MAPPPGKMFALAEEAAEQEPESRRRPDVPPLRRAQELLDRIQDGADRRHHAAARLPHARPGRLSFTDPSPASISELLWQISVPQLPLGERRLLQRLLHPQHRRVLLDERRLAGESPGVRRPALPRQLRRSELRQLLRRIHLRRRQQAVPRWPLHGRLRQRVRQLCPRHKGPRP